MTPICSAICPTICSTIRPAIRLILGLSLLTLLVLSAAAPALAGELVVLGQGPLRPQALIRARGLREHRLNDFRPRIVGENADWQAYAFSITTVQPTSGASANWDAILESYINP